MALGGHSVFYYGFFVDGTCDRLDFQEGEVSLQAVLTHGTYTMAGYIAEVVLKMNAVGGQEYSLSVSRLDRKPVISAANPFKLLCSSGAGQYASAFPVLGFDTEEDLEGANSYIGQNGCGKEYRVQFPLQSYVPSVNNKKAVNGTKKKTATGRIEAARYGSESFMECEMLFITDIPQPAGSIIRSKGEGLREVREFLEYAITFGEVEFMEDENNPDEFEVLVLESTEADPAGMAYKLREEYDQSLPGYYATGKLTWLSRERHVDTI
nr:hypothetical protein CKG001_10210 [Bdellovibrio sp. CKG001]